MVSPDGRPGTSHRRRLKERACRSRAVVDNSDYRLEHPHGALLVIEVALSSLRFDRATKSELYAKAGVGEYWIVDLAAERIEAHTLPSGATYTRVTTYAKGESVALAALPGVTIAVADVV